MDKKIGPVEGETAFASVFIPFSYPFSYSFHTVLGGLKDLRDGNNKITEATQQSAYLYDGVMMLVLVLCLLA